MEAFKNYFFPREKIYALPKVAGYFEWKRVRKSSEIIPRTFL